jgi:hypothetical protein
MQSTKLVLRLARCTILFLAIYYCYHIYLAYESSEKSWLNKAAVLYGISAIPFLAYLSQKGNGKGNFDDWGNRVFTGNRSELSFLQALSFIVWVLIGIFLLFAIDGKYSL